MLQILLTGLVIVIPFFMFEEGLYWLWRYEACFLYGQRSAPPGFSPKGEVYWELCVHDLGTLSDLLGCMYFEGPTTVRI